VKATVDAVFEGGVFKPAQRPDLPEGERVRITVETVQKRTPQEILKLAAQVFEGLSPRDADEIEEMARRRPFFSDDRR
jgi:predicted DNA-binding antitoxin AbrB/MazE fold protein